MALAGQPPTWPQRGSNQAQAVSPRLELLSEAVAWVEVQHVALKLFGFVSEESAKGQAIHNPFLLLHAAAL